MLTNPTLRQFLAEVHSSGAVTAAAAVIGDVRGIQAEGGVGSKRRVRPGRVTTSSLFDLASLTKPVTATLALALAEKGTLLPSTTIGRTLTAAGAPVAPGLRHRRTGSLLRHQSGFQAWTPLFVRCRHPSETLRLLGSTPDLLGAPASTYSDLGYILWALLAESLIGRGFGALVRDFVARPLGISGGSRGMGTLVEPPGDVSGAVECRLGNGRERDLARGQGIEISGRRPPRIGTIQDGNARFLAGPVGHAGLFGSARGLWRLAGEWVRPGAVLVGGSVDRALAGRGRYALGWRRQPPAAANRSGLWYGHTGFTGGGVWFCPETAEVRVLLAHRSAISVSMKDWQARFVELCL